MTDLPRAALLALLLVLGAQDETKAEGSASVSPMSGDLRVWRGVRKKLEAVAKPIQLEADDRLGSPKGEPVILMSDDDIVLSVKGVKVGDKSGLSLVRTTEGLHVRIQDGSVLVDAFEKPLTIETAGGKVTGKQAYFLVEVKDGVSKVTAIDGSLTFSNPAGEVKLDGGQESSAKEGAAPGAPRAATVAEPSRDFAPRGAPANLVKNPGYEEDPFAGWNKLNPKQPLRALDTKVVGSGKNSMRFTVTPETTKWVKAPNVTELESDQFLKLTPGRRYLVRVYVRAQVRKGKCTPVLWVAGVKSVNPQLAKDDMIFENITCADAWKMHRTIVTCNKTDGYVGLKVTLDEAAYDATVWADDWSMVELPR